MSPPIHIIVMGVFGTDDVLQRRAETEDPLHLMHGDFVKACERQAFITTF